MRAPFAILSVSLLLLLPTIASADIVATCATSVFARAAANGPATTDSDTGDCTQSTLAASASSFYNPTFGDSASAAGSGQIDIGNYSRAPLMLNLDDVTVQSSAGAGCTGIGGCAANARGESSLLLTLMLDTSADYVLSGSIGAGPPQGSVRLDGVTYNVAAVPFNAAGVLAAGSHTLEVLLNANTVAGTDGFGTLNFSFQLTQPVPIPAAAWLLASGLGGLGALVRRRKAMGR